MSKTNVIKVHTDDIRVGDLLKIGGVEHTVFAVHPHGHHGSTIQLYPLDQQNADRKILVEMKCSNDMQFYIVRN